MEATYNKFLLSIKEGVLFDLNDVTKRKMIVPNIGILHKINKIAFRSLSYQ